MPEPNAYERYCREKCPNGCGQCLAVEIMEDDPSSTISAGTRIHRSDSRFVDGIIFGCQAPTPLEWGLVEHERAEKAEREVKLLRSVIPIMERFDV